MKKNILFVDCFNTVILRRKSDKDILFNWTKCVGEKYEIEPALLFKLFMQVRKITLGKIIKNKTEMLLTDSIKQIAEILSFNISNFDIDDFCAFAMDSYIETEAKYHYVNEKFISKLRQYKSEGKKIYMVSDFYCKSDILQVWLKRLNVLDIFDNIYVSCEYNCAKYNGSLYRYVLKNLNIKAKEVLMIGDNIHSDVFMANINGIKSKYQFSKLPKNKEITRALLINGSNFNKFKEMIKPNENNSLFSNFSIFYALFCKKLYSNIIKQNAKDIFFLAREGKFLKRIFDGYVDVMREKKLLPYEIKTHYLLVSRNSVFNACLKDLDNEKFDLLFCTINNLSIRSFLTSLNFSKEEQKLVNDTLPLNFKKTILNMPNSKKFAMLKNNEIFRKIYDNKRDGSREAFRKYIDSFGIDFEKEGMFIVDSGWNGTMQGLLDQYFESKVKVKGCYIGCKKSKSKYLRELDKKGLLFDFVNRNSIGNFFFTYTCLNAERICAADHSKVNNYKLNSDGKFEIVYENDKTDEEIFNKYLKNLQDGIYEGIINFAKIDYSNLSYLVLNANSLIPYIIKHKTKKEKDFENFALENYNNGFGPTGYIFKNFNKSSRAAGLRLIDNAYLFISLFRPTKYKCYKILIKNIVNKKTDAITK